MVRLRHDAASLTHAASAWVMILAGAAAAQPYRVVGPPGCGLSATACHSQENVWWAADKHSKSIDLLYEKEALTNGFAAKMGITNPYSGKSSCMSCHGTVVKESADVEIGVSCESCHGPGSGYKIPHQKGYEAGVATGLAKLAEIPLRAELCVRCHLVTDDRLLETGHPDGKSFKYDAGMRTVSKHWRHPATDADFAPASFQKAAATRGGGKAPARATAATPAAAAPAAKPPAAAPLAATTTAPGADAGPTSAATPAIAAPATAPASPPPARAPAPPVFPASGAPPAPRAPAPATPGAVLPAPDAPLGALDLPARPALSDSASVRDLLLAVQKRLELLYDKLGR